MEVVYQVETKHTDDMIKEYVKFQNNVNAPTRKFQSVLIALCVLALVLLFPQPSYRAVFIAIAAFILLRTLTEDWFMVRYVKKEDDNYKKQTIIHYEFGKTGFYMENPNEKEKLNLSYKDIRALYKDEKYWYICIKGGELHMFSKKDVINSDNRFGMFLEKQTGLSMRSAKPTFKEKALDTLNRQEEVEKEKKKKSKRGIL